MKRSGAIRTRLNKKHLPYLFTSLYELRKWAKEEGLEFVSKTGFDSPEDVLTWAQKKTNRTGDTRGYALDTIRANLAPGRKRTALHPRTFELLKVMGPIAVDPKTHPSRHRTTRK